MSKYVVCFKNLSANIHLFLIFEHLFFKKNQKKCTSDGLPVGKSESFVALFFILFPKFGSQHSGFHPYEQIVGKFQSAHFIVVKNQSSDAVATCFAFCQLKNQPPIVPYSLPS